MTESNIPGGLVMQINKPWPQEGDTVFGIKATWFEPVILVYKYSGCYREGDTEYLAIFRTHAQAQKALDEIRVVLRKYTDVTDE